MMKKTVETDRLILRDITYDDFEDLFDIYSDAETMRYYPKPYDEAMLNNLIDRCQKRYREHGHCLWAMILKPEKKLIGDCGIIRQLVKGYEENEIGYHLNKKYWHRGYATEAAAACRDLGFNKFHYKKLISLIRPENLSSQGVARRIGFHKIDETFIFGFEHMVYGMTAGSSSR